MVYLGILAAIALAASIAWLIADPGYDPLVTTIVSLSALVSTFVIQKRKARQAQHQSVSKSSNAIQAGRDVTIVNKPEDKDAK
jgi:Co/Zn/Cd efflux system component